MVSFLLYVSETAYDGCSVLGDHQFLICRDDYNMHLGIRSRDLDLLAACLVGLGIEGDAHESEFLADTFACGCLILAYTACEDDDVDASEHSRVCSDIFKDTVFIHVEREDSLAVALGDGCLDVAHVGRDLRDSGHTAALVDESADAGCVEPFALHHVDDRARIDIAYAGAHHQALGGCEAHGGIHSEMKADAYHPMIKENDLVITADTMVICGDRIMGKPKDMAEAKEMLRFLSGKTHCVATGVTISTQNRRTSFTTVTDVTFADISDDEITYYVENFLPLDKAGAYGIQEWIGVVAVSGIKGSYYNVMGLPVHRLYQELKLF